MKRCPNQQKLVDYLYNELGDEDKQTLQAHIDSCSVCHTTFQEFRETYQELSGYKRPRLRRTQLAKYHRELKKLTQPESRIGTWLDNIIEPLFVRPVLPLRLAEYTIILAIGIWIGRWGLTHPDTNVNSVRPIAIDNKMLDNYLSNAEMLLLDIANMDNEVDLPRILSSTDFTRMLQKTTILKDQVNKTDHSILFNLLDNLELILLELANCDGTLSNSELLFIQQLIKDSHIMLEIKSLNAI